MKKIKICPIIFIAAIFTAMTDCYSEPFDNINEEYFGKETFSETKHMCSMTDLTAIQPVLEQIESAFSYIDTNDSCNCEEKFGALSRYCICHTDAVSENHDVEFITASAEGNAGYIWIRYDQEGLDKNKNVCTGSKGILSRIEIKKTDGVWTATDTDERP